MAQYNKLFELTVEDMDLIEAALRDKQRALCEHVGDAANSNTCPEARQNDMQKTHDLLGRLHNQKNFFRPKQGSYVGG